MIINSLLIGLAEKALPPVNVYSINYKCDLTPHGVPMWFNISLKGHNNNKNKFLKIFDNNIKISKYLKINYFLYPHYMIFINFSLFKENLNFKKNKMYLYYV
jgi:hypothetical protein